MGEKHTFNRVEIEVTQLTEFKQHQNHLYCLISYLGCHEKALADKMVLKP
jgi:hypothetical protein